MWTPRCSLFRVTDMKRKGLQWQRRRSSSLRLWGSVCCGWCPGQAWCIESPIQCSAPRTGTQRVQPHCGPVQRETNYSTSQVELLYFTFLKRGNEVLCKLQRKGLHLSIKKEQNTPLRRRSGPHGAAGSRARCS